jgi:Uma2 family endonuclease
MTVPNPASVESLPRKKFTREEVEHLIDVGAFVDQRYELIDGELIDKMGQKPAHATGVHLVLKWLLTLFKIDFIRVQSPMEASGPDRDRSVPEPDLIVLKKTTPEHRLRHPRGDEVILAVEVSETTVAFDLSRKASLYAVAGVREYWVLDLVRPMLIVHRQPDDKQYRSIQLHPEEALVSLEESTELARVRDLLPAP